MKDSWRECQKHIDDELRIAITTCNQIDNMRLEHLLVGTVKPIQSSYTGIYMVHKTMTVQP